MVDHLERYHTDGSMRVLEHPHAPCALSACAMPFHAGTCGQETRYTQFFVPLLHTSIDYLQPAPSGSSVRGSVPVLVKTAHNCTPAELDDSFGGDARRIRQAGMHALCRYQLEARHCGLLASAA